ncbi:MAG: hypothetical protein H0V82_08860 [Candidatus Protochlamydia sp.]|nr:hypothetical protein [Candidatus Protochlamydia sp.]
MNSNLLLNNNQIENTNFNYNAFEFEINTMNGKFFGHDISNTIYSHEEENKLLKNKRKLTAISSILIPDNIREKKPKKNYEEKNENELEIDPTIGVVKSCTDSDLDVPVLTLDEFQDILEIHSDANSMQRFEKLQSISIKQEENSWVFWLHIPEGCLSTKSTWIYMNIDERVFDSQCFSECDQNYPKASLSNQKYYFINACYDDNENKYFFQIRLDKEIKIAEIIHIERGAYISGTNVKKICMEILDFLKLDKIFLNDDAKIQVVDSKESIALRISLPVSRDDMQTWYSEFKPLSFNNLFNQKNVKYIDQNEETYRTSLDTVRNQSIIALPKTREDANELKKWIKKYLIIHDLEAINACTVNQVVKALLQAARGCTVESQANNDFISFYFTYLIPKNIQSIHKEYKNSLQVLHTYKIWVKTKEQ